MQAKTPYMHEVHYIGRVSKRPLAIRREAAPPEIGDRTIILGYPCEVYKVVDYEAFHEAYVKGITLKDGNG